VDIPYFALLDIGGTDIKSGIYNNNGDLLFLERSKTPNLVKVDELKREITPKLLIESVFKHLKFIKNLKLPIGGLMISGQMGGWITTDKDNQPMSNLVSWQDLRSKVNLDKVSIDPTTIQLNGGESRAGLPIYGLISEYNKKRFSKSRFHTITSFVAANISDKYQYLIHETDIAASGFYDIYNEKYIDELVKVFKSNLLFPKVSKSIRRVGFSTELGCTVYTPVGDQQASLFGAGLEVDNMVVNIGTGGQISKIFSLNDAKQQIRPYFFGKKINTITHLPAGRIINFVIKLSNKGKISKNDFNKFYNAIPISNEFLNVDLSNYEQSKKILERINKNFSEDLESIVSSALITRYVATIEKMRTDNLTKIVFVGGVGQNYEKLHTAIKETFNIQIEVPKINESTLQGLGYLSRNLSK